MGECETTAIELLGPNDECTNSFLTIANNLNSQSLTFDMVDRALDYLCGVTGCRNRVSTFADGCLLVSYSQCCSTRDNIPNYSYNTYRASKFVFVGK